MQSFIVQLVASISIGTITLTAFFAFVGRKVFEHILQRNVEYLKVDIAHAAQISHERVTAVFNIKFERLVLFYDKTIELHDALAAMELHQDNRVEAQEQIRQIVTTGRSEFQIAASKARPFLSPVAESGASKVKKKLLDLSVQFENDRDLAKARIEMEQIRRDTAELCEFAALAIRDL